MRIFSKLRLFLAESREEFKRVNWPTRRETIRIVLVVIGLSLAVAAFLGALDFFFLGILQKILV